MNIDNSIYNKFKGSKKALAVLIDPDKLNDETRIKEFLGNCAYANVDFIFIGGSLLTGNDFETCIQLVKANTKIPVVIFPGSNSQISSNADAILLLSLISGRNADLLIGQHVVAAPALKKSGLEIIPTGYLLIDCGNSTTASYISNTLPIPYNKPEIAAATALAGEQLGLKSIYLDGGSGALKPVNPATIQAVRKTVDVPIIVGGGIKNMEEAELAWNSGANIIVIGTAFEKNPDFITTFREYKAVN